MDNIDKKIINDSFKNRLIDTMNLRNIKAADLSRMTGISKPCLSQYVHGINEAKQTHLYLLAKALDVNEAWLMGFDVRMERADWQKTNDRIADIVVRLKSDPQFSKLVLLIDSLPSEKLNALESVANALLS